MRRCRSRRCTTYWPAWSTTGWPIGSNRLPTLYEQRVGDNHHHLVCRECRVVVDVDCLHGPAGPCLDPDDTQGFVVDEAEVTYWGHCPDCQTATPDHGGHA